MTSVATRGGVPAGTARIDLRRAIADRMTDFLAGKRREVAGDRVAEGRSGPSVVRELELLGRTVGQAFQIIDDDLDLFSTEEELGKPVGGDVREGKRTIFYYLLSRRLPAERWAELQRLYGSDAISDADLERVRALIVESGTRAEALRLARRLADDGRRLSRLGADGRADGLESFLARLLDRAA